MAGDTEMENPAVLAGFGAVLGFRRSLTFSLSLAAVAVAGL
jgi:hypothetical protein